jgi:hypothetical protein
MTIKLKYLYFERAEFQVSVEAPGKTEDMTMHSLFRAMAHLIRL